MRATSSGNEKVQIVKESSKYIHKILEYTYNPFKQYYVTSKTCKKIVTYIAIVIILYLVY